jgi:hypothetical protein
MQITITEPCKIEGRDYTLGDQVDLQPQDALSVVAAGRATTDPEKSAAAVAAAEARRVA